MMKHIQTICRMLSKNCLNVFAHFVGLALKQFSEEINIPSRRISDVFLNNFLLQMNAPGRFHKDHPK